MAPSAVAAATVANCEQTSIATTSALKEGTLQMSSFGSDARQMFVAVSLPPLAMNNASAATQLTGPTCM